MLPKLTSTLAAMLAAALLAGACGAGSDNKKDEPGVCSNLGAGSDTVTIAGASHMEATGGFVFAHELACKPAMTAKRFIVVDTGDWWLHLDYASAGMSYMGPPASGEILNIRLDYDAVGAYNWGIQVDYYPTPTVACHVDLHTTGQSDAATVTISDAGIPGAKAVGSLQVTSWGDTPDPACPAVPFNASWSVTKEADGS